MRILLTGANGYIGKRLLPNLVQEGHTVICCVRDKNRFNPPESLIQNIEITEIDFLDKNSITKIPQNIDGAYYLMHSMTSSSAYEKKELICASNFKEAVNKTKIRHVVYLSGIINETSLSRHLLSRKAVEDELAKGNYNFTTLRAGIIIGSGSASFEIIRDLTEKIPLLLTPIWVRTKCQPIGVRDVKNILTKTMFNVETYNKNFDIGGPDILTYKEMLLGYAKVRGLKRKLLIFPLITPKISSYWLYFLTSTSYKLATALVQSMNVEVVCRNCDINKILDITPIGYEQALKRTLLRIEEHQIVSSWKDSLVSGRIKVDLSEFNTIDVCGTGGDEKKTFNISTLSAFVIAGAGYKVAKHGNYGVSSSCGSSNVLEFLGYRFTNEEAVLKQQLEKANFCMMHAPLFHPAMKNVAPIRKELGIKTFFNMLGPIVNPSFPKNQLVGVFNLEIARVYNYLLQNTEKNYTILHSLDG
ncbi:MAG: NAD(P)H-binding protein, partial [Bacteroidales bacterium]|nr:NAD(P)H-binding protein [Bacteroidales bacterium]